MRQTNGYQTKQKTSVTAYFKAHPSVHFTVDELTEALHSEGIRIGKSTVYRTLHHLTDAGIIRKYTPAAGESACYQYAKDGEHQCDSHFHLKCLVCGTLHHVDCGHLSALAAHFRLHHGFTVDYEKTVLYGTCDACKRALSASNRYTDKTK
ncbi:MAG: transcriptional repressor [Clostridia bacterium]|nr:transcriptional repressor [Clostridia bacterium]